MEKKETVKRFLQLSVKLGHLAELKSNDQDKQWIETITIANGIFFLEILLFSSLPASSKDATIAVFKLTSFTIQGALMLQRGKENDFIVLFITN